MESSPGLILPRFEDCPSIVNKVGMFGEQDSLDVADEPMCSNAEGPTTLDQTASSFSVVLPIHGTKPRPFDTW